MLTSSIGGVKFSPAPDRGEPLQGREWVTPGARGPATGAHAKVVIGRSVVMARSWTYAPVEAYTRTSWAYLRGERICRKIRLSPCLSIRRSRKEPARFQCPRAIRGDRLLEPERCHRPGREGRVTFKAPNGAFRLSHHGAGGHGADTLAGQTTATLTVPRTSLSISSCPSLSPRVTSRDLSHGGSRGRRGQAGTPPGDLRRRARRGFSQDDRTHARRYRRCLVRAVRGSGEKSVRLTLTGTVHALTDELIAEVPIRPWGVRVAASESGTSASMTIFVGLPPGRAYESPEMLLVLSPALRRMVIELALGQDAYLLRLAARDPRRRIS